ncbi:MAG TPA: hypothetical protein PLR06_02330 [Cyclobacteriaceae bacterium]|nr:hypothetical protein [Cyclobacteriaceae bacterium]
MKKLSKKKKELKPSVSKKGTAEKGETNDGKAFDFGGLPDRNLKKNLGC